MSGFTRACALSALPPQGSIHADVDGEPVAVVRTQGEVYAIRDVCSHQNVPLSDGDVEGVTIECWLHGSTFDLRTGQPLCLPANKPVPVYAVRVDGDDVLVDVSRPPSAEASDTQPDSQSASHHSATQESTSR